MDISDLFPAGPIIDERHQIGRGPSIDALTDWLRAGDVVRVFDRRRWGKSSVARTGSHGWRRRAWSRYGCRWTSSRRLLRLLPSSPTRSEHRANARHRKLDRSEQTVGSEEASAVGGLLEGLKPEDVTLQRVLGGIPAELAKTGRRGAIAIDEAHVIAKWDPDDRASLRAFLARDDRLTGIALASSDSHAERKLKRSNVLGYLGEEFTLPAIEIGDWRHGLRSRFGQAEVPIDDEALELLLEEARCHPYCTMLLAKHAAELAQSFGTVTTSVIRLALPTVQKHEAWRLR